jgi:hypothetical protein
MKPMRHASCAERRQLQPLAFAARPPQLPPMLRSKLFFYHELRFPGGHAFDEERILSDISVRRRLLVRPALARE